MNKINPIYILALVFVIFLGSLTILNSKKQEYKSLNKDVSTLKVQGQNFSEYKRNWFNKDIIIKNINKILNHPSIKKEKILRTQVNNILKIKIESDNSRTLNDFLNRILNGKFILKKLDIEKRSIYLEIGLI